MRVAIVHEWLTTLGGSERVLEQMLAMFPAADLFALVDFLPPELRGLLGGRRVTTSFIQRLPGAERGYRKYLPLMPLAVEQWDLSGYDLVLSNSTAVAKGVITGPEQLHICHCCSPMRYAWDLQHQYLRESGLGAGPMGIVARYLLHRIRVWDVRTANGVDEFVAISHYVARRIEKVYRRRAEVIYPPVDVDFFTPEGGRADYYLAASRLVPYKRMDLILEAFAAMPSRRLVVIGDGPDMKKLKRLAAPNVELLGFQPMPVLREHLRRARALVFAAEEDFGILPVEAQACGTPVIAYGRGGSRETVRADGNGEGPTGVFFEEQSAAAIRRGVDDFEARAPEFTVEGCRANALRFSPKLFRQQLGAFVDRAAARARERPFAR